MTRRTLPALDRLITLIIPTYTGATDPETNHPIEGEPQRRRIWAAQLQSELELTALSGDVGDRTTGDAAWLIRYDPAVCVGLNFEDDSGSDKRWEIRAVEEVRGRRRFLELRATQPISPTN